MTNTISVDTHLSSIPGVVRRIQQRATLQRGSHSLLQAWRTSRSYFTNEITYSAGELFALNRNYFIELDGDDGTNIWEGENLEIPCQIWVVEVNSSSSLTLKSDTYLEKGDQDTYLEKGDHMVLLKVRIS